MPAPAPSRLPDTFSAATHAWFAGRFATATAVQQQAWTAISAGEHVLAIAPTGSGKTLAAFLHAIDALFAERERASVPDMPAARSEATRTRTRVLYISPIKALGADIQRNLQVPLQGVNAERARRGDPAVEIAVAMRTGDTPPSARAALLRRPPDILITTPESLFLMLTSKARETLRGVRTVIIDEIHAVAGTKRGTHLALSLERLDALLPAPAQRIGLSATVRPVEVMAQFLGGDRAVTVVNPPSTRQLEMRIVVPVEDMADLPAQAGPPGQGDMAGRPGSIWPHVEASILDEVLRHRSTIVFVNSRGVAEKLTARLNALHAERMPVIHAARHDPARQGEEDAAHHEQAQQYGSFTGSTVNRVTPPATAHAELIARSHHGSVSKEQRTAIEHALKSGALRCVVATSSLELGIDMGLVDLVIQVAAPPSVASALQRVGRAGHQVGGVSRGVVYPRTRRDLIDAAVCVDSMLAGDIEAIAPPRNPLDVLAQQTVAAVAMEPWDADAWFASVRRAAPYQTLSRQAFDATLDMLSGRYPSDAFAGFRPKLVWNRTTGQLTARPGARQLAVTSGGTIPDRGMYSVMLPEGEERAGSRRVGELDEEMVYESRVNDVITLGATSWRIQQITHDQVVVTPAPGRSARLPFWRGEGAGRPAELGTAIGAFLGELDAGADEVSGTTTGETSTRHARLPAHLQARLRASGLDANAINNMVGLVTAQRVATGVLPTDQRLVVERCRDELGDWRVMLHSPYGRRVHDPWALAVAQRLGERWGIDPTVVASDDGILLRIPDSTGRVPGAELFVFETDGLRRMITEAVGGSALFAARFRECASRALLLPRRTPGRRSPLWQQRLRGGQLLDVARQYPEFPILIETARECLQDVYDLDALDQLMQRIASGAVQCVDVVTDVPSPFAADLLFGYVAEFMYGTDVPLAERRASVLSLDSGLLQDLLGQVDLGELLDARVVAQVQAELQRLEPARQAKGLEGIADLLRELGPLATTDVMARVQDADGVEDMLATLVAQQRAIVVQIGGAARWAAIEDAARLRDGLGARLPDGIPAVFLAPLADPLGDLLSRIARTHGPFTTAQAAAQLGLGTAVADEVLQRLRDQGRVLHGQFGARDADEGDDVGSPRGQRQWLDEDVFRRLKLRSLQAAREATRPVPQQAHVRLLLERHGVIVDALGSKSIAAMEGIEGVANVIAQLGGVPLPVSLWESQVLPARVRDYQPGMLDELIATGAVLWAGHARAGDDDGLVSLHLQATADETLARSATDDAGLPPRRQAILRVLADGGAYFARQLAETVSRQVSNADMDADAETFHAALWALVWAGRVTSDTWSPLRALSGARAPARQRPLPLSRRRQRMPGFPVMGGVGIGAGGGAGQGGSMIAEAVASPTLVGRWALVPRGDVSDTVRMLALAEGLLDRHGVVTRGAAVLESVDGGFPALQPVYRSMEDAGKVLRGRFVEGLGGAQFADRGTIDRLRAIADAPADAAQPVVALSVLDPASPFGSIMPWPDHPTGQRPPRRAGALVVLGGGRPLLHLAPGGRSLLTWIHPADPLLPAAAQALADALRRGRRLTFTLELVDDAVIARGPLADALRAAGFSRVPKGLAWGG